MIGIQQLLVSLSILFLQMNDQKPHREFSHSNYVLKFLTESVTSRGCLVRYQRRRNDFAIEN